MMRKLTSILVILVGLFFVLVGCEDTNTIDVNDIDIIVTDQISIPAGTYTLEYTIENWGELVKNYGAVLQIEVRNKSNQLVTLSGNTIVVEVDEVYTVQLTVTMKGETKVKTFIVSAITAQEVQYTVSFDLQGGIGSFPQQTVVHGGVPNLPELEPTRAGYVFNGWFYDIEYTEFCDFSEPIYEDTILYAGFTEVVQNLVTVTFVTDGANEPFLPISLSIGGFLPTLATPTKAGFRFDGWYLESTFETPFLVEVTNIYQNTTLYAKWVDTTLVSYTVTYDLNGALQTGSITELVIENEVAKGFGVTPVRSGYRLEGYSLTAIGEELYDFATPVNSNITLYAIWLYNYTEVEHISYFTGIQALDHSYLDDSFFVVQRMLISGNVDLIRFKQDQSVNEDASEFGVLYGETDQLTYQSRGIIKVNETPFSPNVSFIDYLLDTNGLKENTTYFIRFYVKFENTILYSDTESFETIEVVEGGTAVGLNYVVSGGEYYHSDPQIQLVSRFYYEVLQGYEALDNRSPYQSYNPITVQGTHSVIVTDLATNIQYLHVYRLKFDKPFVNTSLYEVEVVTSTSVRLEFRATLLHEDKYTYPISDAGFLYSRNTYALLKGVPGVNDSDADYNESTAMIKSTSTIVFYDLDNYYIRSYVVLSGKVHYSNLIYEFAYDQTENHYRVINTINVESQKQTIEYPYEYFIGTGTYNVHYYNGTELLKSTVTGNGQFSVAGYYFARPGNMSFLYQIEMVGTYPVISGVTNFGEYQDSVYIEFDMPNVYWYMSFNGGEYVYLPYKVRLEKVGYYTLYYRTPTGIETLYFEIK